MNNHWTKEEIALTRHAWRLYDASQDRKFIRVGWLVSIASIMFITAIVAIGGH